MSVARLLVNALLLVLTGLLTVGILELVPHAEYVDVADAAHMVAGDRNDAFSDAVVEFLSRTAVPPAVAAQAGR